MAGGSVLGMAKIPLIIIATVGYTIGVTINYFLAKILGKSYVEKKLSKKRYEVIVRWWNKWGILLLIAFAFIPILPFNILALICGLLNVRLSYFLLINFAGDLVNSYLFVFLGEGIGRWIGLL